MPENFYMVYRAADDKILATGTSRECAKQMGLTGPNCFLSLVSKTRKGKIKKYEIVVEKEGELE